MKKVALFVLLFAILSLTGCTLLKDKKARTPIKPKAYDLPLLNNPTITNGNKVAVNGSNKVVLPDPKPINLTLNQAIKTALGYSLRITLANAKVNESKERINEAESGYYPKLQGMVKSPDWLVDRSISRSFDQYAQAQLSLQHNLFNFGQTTYSVNSANDLYKAMQHNAISETDSVTYDTVKAYLDKRRYMILQQYANEYVNEMTKLVDTLQIRVKGGLSPRSELIRGQLALTNAKNRQQSIELQLTKAEQELLTILGRNIFVDEENLQDIDLSQVLNTDNEINRVLTNNPAIKARLSEVNAAKQDVAFAKAARYPSVDVVGGYGIPFQHPDNTNGNYLGMNVAVQVSMPIFDGGVNSSRIGQATARLQAAQATYGQLLRDMKNTTANLVSTTNNAKGIWQIQSVAEQDAHQTQKLYLDEFKLGSRTLNDLLTVQTDYFTARVGKTNALYDYYLSSLGLHLLAGRVNEGIRLLNLH